MSGLEEERVSVDEPCDHRDGYGSTVIVGETPANAPVCIVCDQRFPQWPVVELIGPTEAAAAFRAFANAYFADLPITDDLSPEDRAYAEWWNALPREDRGDDKRGVFAYDPGHEDDPPR